MYEDLHWVIVEPLTVVVVIINVGTACWKGNTRGFEWMSQWLASYQLSDICNYTIKTK